MPVFQQWKPQRVDGLRFRSRSRRMKYSYIKRGKKEWKRFFLDWYFKLLAHMDTAEEIKQVVMALLSHQYGKAQPCLWLTRIVNDI